MPKTRKAKVVLDFEKWVLYNILEFWHSVVVLWLP